jgi:hypothetical protein
VLSAITEDNDEKMLKHEMHYIHANLPGSIFLAMPWLKRLAAGFPSQWRRFDFRSGHVRFVVDSVVFGRFSPSTSVSPANSHVSICSLFLNHPIINTI